tara:strand:- start:2271 stop:2522 length:252 start_codon:yes stop_codon:yes gene_type:complete
MRRVHRLIIPSPISTGDGILVDASWRLNKSLGATIDNLKIYYIINSEIGKDVAPQVDLNVYLICARATMDELETYITENGSNY